MSSMRRMQFWLCSLLLVCSVRGKPLVNLSHLDALCETMQLEGKPCVVVHIYADAPDYRPTDAADEGISCVDDVARAAIVYMRAIKQGLSADLERLKGLLRFVLYMQAEDGEFYNFIDRRGQINMTGVTSRKDFAFWAARGYWALGEGFAFFNERDHEFADSLRTAFLRCKKPVAGCLQNYGKFSLIHGRLYPDWLMLRHASDATSELLLGFSAFLQAEDDSLLKDFAGRLGQGIVAMQIEEPKELRGAFESWPGIWHAWGNSQVQALAALSGQLGDEHFKAAALRAAPFLARLAVGHPVSAYTFRNAGFSVYPQIAYDVRPTALGLLELHRLTGGEQYALLAGLSASWLSGLNVAGAAMYDPPSGRVYDGIDPEGVNLNAGAESTIEGLMTLLEITAEPRAACRLGAKPLTPLTSLFPAGRTQIRLQSPAGLIDIERCDDEEMVRITWD